MKSKKEAKKQLRLDTETVRVLQSNELDHVQGGQDADAAAAGWSISISVSGNNCCNCS
jgi:hypothetical protein